MIPELVVCGDRGSDSFGFVLWWELLQERVSKKMVISGSVAWFAYLFALPLWWIYS